MYQIMFTHIINVTVGWWKMLMSKSDIEMISQFTLSPDLKV